MSVSPPSQGGFRWVSYLIMINYVNNAYDKVLKPCDAQRFSIIINSQETEKHILGHRGGDAKAKSKLPALTYMGVLDSEKYRKYLKTPSNSPSMGSTQSPRKLGSRRAEFMRPTGLLMLDFDHVGSGVSRDGVTLSNAKSLAESPGEKGLLGEAEASFVADQCSSRIGIATDAHSASAQREILHSAQDDRDAVIDSPVKLWGYIVSEYRERGAELSDDVALAHITPSGDGLRVVVKRVKGFTIERSQQEWCDYMNLSVIGIKPDAACKDISRLSFAPMHKEVLYYNPSLLFAELPEASDYPDGSLWGGDPLRALLGTPSAPQSSARPSMNRGTSTECGGSSKQSAEQNFPDNYNGISYDELIKRLEEQLGGAPEHGARNSFIFSMACNLRYICNDDAAWVASILPTYGEDPQKHRMTIQSAINRPMSREMPATLARALRVAQGELSIVNGELSIATPPEMPASLPEPLAMLLSRTPQPMRAAVAMAVFPPLGAHLHEATFHYWDNRDYEPTFMNVLVAELSSGKSAVNTPIEYIIADIEARDEVAREREREWKSQCATISNAKDKPQRPKGLAIQCLSADMTNAAFVQRLADAEGRFLYTQMDEIELLDSLKTNTRGGSVSAVLRLAFDCGKYGQERVASNAVNAKVRVRWNWNASTTVQRVRKYFAHSIADGTLSRLSFATILKSDEDWGDTYRPVYGDYGQAFADALHPYIDALCCCKGTLRCPEAEQWALSLSDELVDFARQLDDRTYATMSFRAVLMGFFRAMVLYVMNGCRWTTLIADFAAWSVRYDLWCKMRFFRDMLHKDMDGERAALQRGPVSLLTLLPTEFTRQQAEELRVAQGMKPNPKAMLSTWKKRGYVTLDEQRGVYVQTKRS